VAGEQVYRYSVPETAWAESFGNHRVVLDVKRAADVARLDFQWRRPDAEVANHRFLIVNAETGDTVQHVHRLNVNNDQCSILFGPVSQGKYYFYYLPYTVQGGAGFYGGHYLKPEVDAENLAAKKAKVAATVVEVQSRTQHDTFYPMELISTENEVNSYVAKYKRPFYLFGEDRIRPIKMKTHLPMSWMEYKQGSPLKMQARPNEYYAFQVGVWSPDNALDDVRYSVSDFTGEHGTISAASVVCYNIEGVSPDGKPFVKKVSAGKGMVQPLWFGIDIPRTMPTGKYTATMTVKIASGVEQTLPLELEVTGNVIGDRGDGETWRFSRLRWLNSTLGISDEPIQRYSDVSVTGDTVSCTHKSFISSEDQPLPTQLSVNGSTLLSAPIRFVVTTDKGDKTLSGRVVKKDHTTGHAETVWEAMDDDLMLSCKSNTEFDGWSKYDISIVPKHDLQVSNVRLEMDFRSEATPNFMGLGLAGEETPVSYEGKWDKNVNLVRPAGAPEPTAKDLEWLWPFDSFWIGGIDAGVQCEFRGSVYSGPLLNLYRPPYPSSWYNSGKGGFTIKQMPLGMTRVTAYSGATELKANVPATYSFTMLLTPVKKLDTASQFINRYYHNGSMPEPNDSDVSAGVRIINVHHANYLNPIINYPFCSVDTLRAFVHHWHQRGCKVKIYYTLRELTSAATELWAMRSFGDEILHAGSGGGYPWLREHLVTDYYPQWYHHFRDLHEARGITADAALLTSEGDSRWYNYYVEGLRWLVKNIDIDGIYMDDVSFGRDMLKRMRRAMESVKNGCIIDLHSNTGFSHGPATQYTEFFPYIDKIWFGESFQYDRMSPANWLVETSGIPFGLMGDMLQGGGNRWLGMQYGMTVRYPWVSNLNGTGYPRVVWKVWDDFDIAHAKMTGYWQPQVPVTTDDPLVKVTVYQHSDGRMLLSLGNYSDTERTVHLIFQGDAPAKGTKPSKGRKTEVKRTLVAPSIEGYQEGRAFNSSDAISCGPRRGWLLYVEKQ
jgi:hypothetical protein